jgi:hypothetical protein
MHAVAWTPRSGETGVPRDTTIRVRFDAYPDPNSVDYSGLIVTTGVFFHPGTIRLDLIEKTVTYAPAGVWRPDLGYQISLRPSMRSLQGCPAAPDQRTFRTATAAPPPAPPATTTPYSAVQPIFAARCAGAACHRADDGGCLAAPAAGLSLCDAQAVDATLDVPSSQVSDLSLVAPRDSARSYLLRKLLPGATPNQPAPTALGHRDPPGQPLSNEELHTIASWIDDGPLR